MRRIRFALVLLFCFSPALKSQAAQTHPSHQEKSIAPIGAYGYLNSFSIAKLTSTDLDTAKLLSDQPLKSPMGAVLRSAVLPGWGQVYNEKYLKGIFVFSVNGVFAYAIYHHHHEWKETGNKTFQNKRNLFTWYFAVSYFLTLIDAYVDAYLFGFEKAVELALPLKEQRYGLARANAFEIKDTQRNTVGLKIYIQLQLFPE